MPANVVKTPQEEKIWNEAKDAAAKQGHAEDWPYIMGIYKKMTGKDKAVPKAAHPYHDLTEKIAAGIIMEISSEMEKQSQSEYAEMIEKEAAGVGAALKAIPGAVKDYGKHWWAHAGGEAGKTTKAIVESAGLKGTPEGASMVRGARLVRGLAIGAPALGAGGLGAGYLAGRSGKGGDAEVNMYNNKAASEEEMYELYKEAAFKDIMGKITGKFKAGGKKVKSGAGYVKGKAVAGGKAYKEMVTGKRGRGKQVAAIGIPAGVAAGGAGAYMYNRKKQADEDTYEMYKEAGLKEIMEKLKENAIKAKEKAKAGAGYVKGKAVAGGKSYLEAVKGQKGRGKQVAAIGIPAALAAGGGAAAYMANRDKKASEEEMYEMYKEAAMKDIVNKMRGWGQSIGNKYIKKKAPQLTRTQKLKAMPGKSGKAYVGALKGKYGKGWQATSIGGTALGVGGMGYTAGGMLGRDKAAYENDYEMYKEAGLKEIMEKLKENAIKAKEKAKAGAGYVKGKAVAGGKSYLEAVKGQKGRGKQVAAIGIPAALAAGGGAAAYMANRDKKASEEEVYEMYKEAAMKDILGKIKGKFKAGGGKVKSGAGFVKNKAVAGGKAYKEMVTGKRGRGKQVAAIGAPVGLAGAGAGAYYLNKKKQR